MFPLLYCSHTQELFLRYRFLAVLLLVLLFIPASPAHAATSFYRGVNLFGAWQSGWGGQDTFASDTQIKYYTGKGLNYFRVPILWESLQPQELGPLDATYLGKMDALVSSVQAHGGHIAFTFINQGQRPAKSGVPLKVASLQDVWTKLAQHYKSVDTVDSYDLMNEPWHDATWVHDAQLVINSIRTVDPNKRIIASPLDNQPIRYDNNFVPYTGGNIGYEAHVYGDHPEDPSGWGIYDQPYDATKQNADTMVNRVKPFVAWCEAHNVFCTVGEYGIPGGWAQHTPTPDANYTPMLENLLSYMDKHSVSGTYWNGGPFGDVNSVEPINGADMPQMAILTKHLAKTATPLAYADEFNAPFDPNKYNTCYKWACAAGWNAELERYVPEQVTTHDGVLDLRADKRSVIAHGITYNYVSGMVTTADKFSFQYGYTEVRFKVPSGKGLWPAIWMLAQNGQSTTELDLLENIGDNDIHSGMHWLDGSGNHKHQGTTYTVPNLSADWHTIGVDWQSNYVSFSLDGKEYYRETDPSHIPHTPMYLLANLAVGGTWPGNPTPQTVFPADFLLDYIHVTTASTTPTPVPPSPTPAPTILPTQSGQCITLDLGQYTEKICKK